RVTLLDMLVARALLELASSATVLCVLIVAAVALDFAEWPADPLLVGAALLLLGCFSFGLSMLITFLSHESPVAGRLVHPLLYLSMPLSGAFYSMAWFGKEIQGLLSWIPTVPIFELLRVGMFEGYSAEYGGVTYPLAWCAGLTLAG